ncbi:MAG: ribosome maturation factor RimP [Ignavibacteriae bacterium]|nr:ribosome maturation factor RimP [Ignavibacteria bacterium]MBI3363689.1 ribosome maturation factor RimP [Ignavibacteriota bacterium]
MSLIEQVEEIARPVVEGRNAFIVDLSIRGNQGQKVVELFIDTDTGVTTEQCAHVSRELSHALDNADLIRGQYHLVVSSPGIDRPLKYPRQYSKNIGRSLAVTVREGDQVGRISGELLDVTGEGITLKTGKDDSRSVRFDEIVDVSVRAPW